MATPNLRTTIIVVAGAVVVVGVVTKWRKRSERTQKSIDGEAELYRQVSPT